MKTVLFLAVSLIAFAEPPPEVTELLRLTSDAMANGDAAEFLKHVDPAMPRYAELAQRLNLLLTPQSAASTIDVAHDEGDENKRRLELNWLIQAGAERQKRGKIIVTVERKNGAWRFTSIEPIEFFAP